MGWYCANCGEPRDLQDFRIPCRCGGVAIRTATVSDEEHKFTTGEMNELADKWVRVKRPEVIVLDSNDIPDDEDGAEYGQNFLADVARETGAVVIAVPGGNILSMTRAEAREALLAVIEGE